MRSPISRTRASIEDVSSLLLSMPICLEWHCARTARPAFPFSLRRASRRPERHQQAHASLAGALTALSLLPDFLVLHGCRHNAHSLHHPPPRKPNERPSMEKRWPFHGKTLRAEACFPDAAPFRKLPFSRVNNDFPSQENRTAGGPDSPCFGNHGHPAPGCAGRTGRKFSRFQQAEFLSSLFILEESGRLRIV